MSGAVIELRCVECGRILNFHIENDVVVGGDGRIACNIPAAVCPDCVDSVLGKVTDPPGLIVIDQLSSAMAEELLGDFKFLLPKSESTKFFALLFPDVGLDGKL